jgi:general secretion pathway protein H
VITAPAANSRTQGYTLAELMVVLAIIALTSAVVAPRLVISNNGPGAKTSAQQLMNLYRQGQQLALTTGISQQVLIDTDSKMAWIDGGSKKLQLGRKVDLETKTAEPESAPGIAGVRFFPDGASTGGEIKFLTDQASWQLEVIWANGDVRVHKLP